jgi:hypothetical protein
MTSLDQARRYADQDAQEAREFVLGMRSTHSNYFLVIDGIREAMEEDRGADFSEVTEMLEAALVLMNKVYSYTPEERSAWVAEDLAEQRRAA